MLLRHSIYAIFAYLWLTLLATRVAVSQTVYDRIRAEATASNTDNNHPLPLFSSWSQGNQWYYLNSGQYVADSDGAGFTPAWVMQMIAQGHHLMPWLLTPPPGPEIAGPHVCTSCADAYYQNAVGQAAAQTLPLNFVGTQWDSLLSTDSYYLSLPYSQNPNVVTPSGVVQAKLSPFGGLDAWYQVGLKWGSSPRLQWIQQLYPNPPLILFVSNNEANRLQWAEAETDNHYLDLYGTHQSDDFKRQVFADGWITRYRKLQQGFRDGLSSAIWRAKARFVGYEAFGPSFLGRWPSWIYYSLYIPHRIDPNALMWDGGSADFYYADYSPSTDYKVFSPAIEAMNWEFMQNEAHQLNPAFWFEMSIWAGGDSFKNLVMAPQGQNWTPARYAGSVQFGMWLNRPRIVRDFPYNSDAGGPRSVNQPWMDPVIAAVDRVYGNSTLTTFWRQGQLVPNTSRQHPYQSAIPSEYASTNRMFLLTANLDPPQPWSLDTVLPVFSLARVIGTTPNRRWLVYAFSPQVNRTGVQVTIPGYRTVSINATVNGSFFLVDEATNSVAEVNE